LIVSIPSKTLTLVRIQPNPAKAATSAITRIRLPDEPADAECHHKCGKDDVCGCDKVEVPDLASEPDKC
jgi:hypothetical protein